MESGGELLISEVICELYNDFPTIDCEEMKNKISKIVSKFHIKRVVDDEIHPDLSEKIELFLSSKKLEGLSSNTIYSYKLELGMFSEHVKKKVVNITTADIRVFLSKYDHLKTSSLSRKLSVLKSFFSWLTSEELLQRDPSVKIKQPKKEKIIPKALSIEELELLREACQTSRQRTLIECLYATGARLSEMQQLNIKDIDFQSMSCKVYGKGSKERVVYFSFKAMYHLKKYLNSRDDNDDALIVTERKPYRRLSRRAIQREVKKIASAVGLEDKVTPHVLRHTMATLTLNNGAELVAIQSLLGHANPQTTLRYATLNEEKKRESHKKYLIQ